MQKAIAMQETKIIGTSKGISHCIEYVEAVAQSDATVLVLGESGVGKELIAEHIHSLSPRKDKNLVIVNCASIPRDLFESEFFGHIQGAFTGASRNRVGRFEAANYGTLVLDEVGEIPPELQGKLLRALQQATFERVGEDKTRRVDVRVIAITNRDLSEDVNSGRFRRDLYYRLSTFIIDVPPLRERKEDIRLLANAFLKDLSKKYKCKVPALTPQDETKLTSHDWPGNIRELKNIIERAFILGLKKNRLELDLSLPGPNAMLPIKGQEQPSDLDEQKRNYLTYREFSEFERKNLIAALEEAQWKLSGKGGAADLLGLKPSTLASKLTALNITKPKGDSLYRELGGEKRVASFSRDLLGRLQSDPQLARFWIHRSNDGIEREEKLLTQYLCSNLGGPQLYLGESMIKAHKGLNITESDWGIFLRHLKATFENFQLSKQSQHKIMAMIELIGPEIIQS